MKVNKKIHTTLNKIIIVTTHSYFKKIDNIIYDIIYKKINFCTSATISIYVDAIINKGAVSVSTRILKLNITQL